MKKHRILAFLLSFALLLGFVSGLPTTARADCLNYGSCGRNLTWTLEDGTLTISGTGDMTNYSFSYVPSWHSIPSNVTKVVVENGVTSIGDCAFANHSSLTSITLPDSLISIGNSAFSSCTSLTSITLPDSLTSIGDNAFWGCKGLTSITIPNSVTTIWDGAFRYCTSLRSITIPKNVTSIGAEAFAACHNLTTMNVAKGNSVYHSAGNCIIQTNSKKLIAGCKSSVIPTDGSVTSIGNGAFFCCEGLTSITIPNSVTSIGDYAFSGCDGLTSITIPNSVTSIGDLAFYLCSGLTSMKVASGNPVYHSAGNCIIKTNSKTVIAGCKSSIIPTDGSVTSIGDYAFAYTNLASIIIPDSVTSIGDEAFSSCTSLTSITLPDSVTSISYGAFAECTSLTSITIPNSVTRIGNWAFGSCSGLTDVYYDGSKANWAEISIGEGNECLTNATVHFNENALTITSQPTSQTVKADATAKFTVKATGTDLKYQWQYRTFSSGSWKNSGAASATTASFSVKATTARNGYQYRCQITDAKGKVVYTNAVTLTVTGGTALTISTQPKTQNVKADATAKFTVKATGSGLKYQWQYRTSSSGSWKNSGAASATTATFSVKGTTARNGYQYRCKVTDSAGNTVYSKTATLYVLGITTQPKTTTVANNATAKFTVKATGNSLKYQWQYRTSSSGSWNNSGATSATTASFSVKGTAARNGYQYRCKITDSAGNSVYSTTVTLKVSAASITTQPKSVTVSEGSTAKFTVKTSGSGLTYQWQYQTSSSGSWKNSGATSATTKTFSVKGTKARNGYQYRCKITDANGNVIYTNTVTLTVN